MTKKIALLLIPVALIVYIFYSGLAVRIDRKVKSLIAQYKPHDAFVPTAVDNPSFNPLSIVSKVENSPTPTFPPLPASARISNIQHEYQTWNNCGPATMAMNLSFYNSTVRQKDIAPFMKPDPDDKNVSPDEMVDYVKENTDLNVVYGLNGNTMLIKQLLAHNIPVIVETWFIQHENDEMGHYELVVAYDDTKQQFTVYDSFRGPNINVSYDTFDDLWKVYNRTFFAIYPKKEDSAVQAMLKPYMNRDSMLQSSLQNAQEEIKKDGSDKFAYFNLGTTLSLLNKHQDAAMAFDKSRSLQLPWRMLWYQFEIFDTYLAVGRTKDVIELTNANLNQANNLEESLYYRGKAYEMTGEKDKAKQDYQQAIRYNSHFKKAAEALESL